MGKKKRYIDYDYEKIYESSIDNLDEWFVDYMLKKPHACVYACREYYMKEQLEINIYPEFSKVSDLPPGSRTKRDNSRAQANLNDKNAKKCVERLILMNFDDGDYWLTLTYDNEHLPGYDDWKQAQKNICNFFKRVNYRRKKRGLPNAKYIYITEYNPDSKDGHRWHHHVIMDRGIPMEELEQIWGKSSRNTLKTLQKDEYGLIGVSKYITKEKKKGMKRWSSSKGNLKQVRPRKNHYKFKRKQVDEMVRNRDSIKQKMEEMYKGYIFTDQHVYYNDFNGKFYINVRMRKQKRFMRYGDGEDTDGENRCQR